MKGSCLMKDIVLNDAELAAVSGGEDVGGFMAYKVDAAQGTLLPTGTGTADPSSVLPEAHPTPTS
jgi:hypothetical protein